MKLYYEHAGITIYHGDCREVLLDLDLTVVDLVLTDPPYGVNGARGSGNRQRGKAKYQSSSGGGGDEVCPLKNGIRKRPGKREKER